MKRRAVVLIGGQSQRMGVDKSLLEYHGKPQRDYLLELLESCGFDAVLAGREEQQRLSDSRFLLDRHIQCGPASGILSALEFWKAGSVLVLSCDQPLIDVDIIESLWQFADKATSSSMEETLMHCFYRERMPGAPETFPSIWKIDALPLVKAAVLNQRYKIRNILPDDRVACHNCPDYGKLININTPDQWRSWRNDYGLE